MPPPLSDGQVNFANGAPNKLPDEARDVVTFLSWAAEPDLDMRHHMGIKVFLFLLVAAGLFYAAKRKIWARVH
jgi:ubiquinol-cytochrome c reductase cytochrome c1 subunit